MFFYILKNEYRNSNIRKFSRNIHHFHLVFLKFFFRVLLLGRFNKGKAAIKEKNLRANTFSAVISDI